MPRLMRMLNTVRYLRPGQVLGRVWRNYSMPRPELQPAPRLRAKVNGWTTSVSRQGRWNGPTQFSFAGQSLPVATPAAWTDGSQADALWLYNLHYFDDLAASGAGSQLSADQCQQLVQRWIAENPPGQGCGWDAYPTSLRIVNWIKWSLAGNPLSAAAQHSLAVQTRWLARRLEFHLLGNHLLANAKALIFAGLHFDGPEADGWLTRGLQLLTEQLAEQILHDGGHFELSPMYHAIVLEDLLDLSNLAHVYAGQCTQLASADVSGWQPLVNGMLRWLMTMSHPDGQIAFFNDAAFGIAATPGKLCDYARRLDFAAPALPTEGITHLESSGYVRMQCGPAVLIADIGRIGPDYLPGHAHADTLTFELSLFGRRAIVNSGTSTYHSPAERQRQRGTAAHNTVEVDGQDSSEVWAQFRVARRAYPREIDLGASPDGTLSLACSHDGYRRLRGKVLHRRRWRLSADRLVVADSLSGQLQQAVARLHLHPDVEAKAGATADAASREFRLPTASGQPAQMTIEHDQTAYAQVQVLQDQWHPEFGGAIGNLCWQCELQRPANEILVRWHGPS